jgi:hypothetical protein
MRGMRVRIGLLGLCLVALTVIAAPTAAAGVGTTEGDEIVDVSKQVSEIEKKLGDLLDHGRWARAGDLLESADCEFGEPSTFFAPWGDGADYVLAPQGDLSETDGWTLDKGTEVDASADPFSGAARSLRFRKGSEAATPAMCVNLDHPTIRFFVRDSGGDGKSQLAVDVLYEDFSGGVKHLTVARVRAGTAWRPSAIVPMYVNMLALASPSGWTAVAFRFKAEGLQKGETVSISSLYVDPFKSR